MTDYFKEHLKYQQYHRFFRWLTIPLILLFFFLVYFFQPKPVLYLYPVLLLFAIYLLISFFIVPEKYIGYKKFFIDLGLCTFFILLLIHFSGSVKSFFFPFIFLPFVMAAWSTNIRVLLAILIISFSYYFLIFILNLWLKAPLYLDLMLVNLLSLSIIGYLNFLLAFQVKKKIVFFKKMDEIKSVFITTLTHQLRGPISTSRWLIEELLKSGPPKDSEAYEYLGQLKVYNQNLITLINNLAKVVFLEEPKVKLNFQKVDINNFIYQQIEKFSSLAKQKNIKIIFQERKIPKINTDPKILDLIFDNLISNAIIYSPVNQSVEIVAEMRKSEILCQVKDYGIGIRQEDQDRIFQKFYRAKNARQKETEGSGLGLYIVKTATELLGGKVWFTSQEGKGSTFYFILPLKIKD